jgi:hypothetical protein
MKQTRQPVCAIKQSIYLDVYGLSPSATVGEETAKKVVRFQKKNKPVYQQTLKTPNNRIEHYVFDIYAGKQLS